MVLWLSYIESVQTEFIKRALGVKKQTSNLAIYGETGSFPLELRQMELQLRYWSRLAATNPDDPLYHVYHQLLRLHKVGIKTWCDNIKHSLEFLGLTNVWSMYINGTPFEQILPLVSNVKRAMENKYKHTWLGEINNSEKNPVLRTFRLFKSEHGFENYLLCPNYRIRKILTKFRVSSHDLQIEKGRHVKPIIPHYLRLCRFCSVVDEYQFLTQYPYHDVERNHFQNCITPYLKNFVNWNQTTFIDILSSGEIALQNALGKFMIEAFLRRSNRDKSK